MDSFVETIKESKKLYQVHDGDKIIETKKNAFEAWSTMIAVRGSDKIKDGELIHYLSIRYAIKNYQYPEKV